MMPERHDGLYEEPSERARHEARAAQARKVNEGIKATTAETMSKIDRLTGEKIPNPGDRSPR